MDPIGKKYDISVTRNGLFLTTCQGISPVKTIDLTPEEALALLQNLYFKRDMLLQGACPALRHWLYPCPHCQTLCPLDTTPIGYEGGCANCGDVFRLNLSARLIDDDYASYEGAENKEATAREK